MENQLLRITTALSEIEQKHYFFGPLIRRLKVENTDHCISTMGVEFDTLRLLYNNEFVSSLSDSGLEFVLMHEIMHIVNKHHERFDSSVPFMLNNIAGDLEINSFIEKVLNYPRSVPGQYPDMYKFPELQTLEQYLELIKNNPEFNQDGDEKGQSSNSDSQNGSGSGNSSNTDQSNQDKDSDKDDSNKNSEENSEGESKESENDKSNENGKSSGNSPGKVDPKDPLKGDVKKGLKKLEENFSHSEVKKINEAIDNIRQELGLSGSGVGDGHAEEEHDIEQVDECWDLYELAEKVSKKHVQVNDDFTYRRLSRRDYGSIIMPGRMKTEKKAIKLAIVVDTSGSVHGFINKMASSLKDFQKRFNRKYSHYECDVDIYFTDTQVQKVVPLKKLGKKIPYGGGTSLCSALPEIARSKKKYNDIIFFTDAEDYSYNDLEPTDPKIYVAITSVYQNDDDMTIEHLKSMDKYHKVTPVILQRYRDA